MSTADLLKQNVCRKRTWVWFSTWGGPPDETPPAQPARPEDVVWLHTNAKRYGIAVPMGTASLLQVPGKPAHDPQHSLIADFTHVIGRLDGVRADRKHRKQANRVL